MASLLAGTIWRKKSNSIWILGLKTPERSGCFFKPLGPLSFLHRAGKSCPLIYVESIPSGAMLMQNFSFSWGKNHSSAFFNRCTYIGQAILIKPSLLATLKVGLSNCRSDRRSGRKSVIPSPWQTFTFHTLMFIEAKYDVFPGFQFVCDQPKGQMTTVIQW